MQDQAGQLERLGEEQGRWLLLGLHLSPIAGPWTQDTNKPEERS
jgi:hypothetical protein